MADYYTLLTNAGIAYETACKAAGVPIKLTQISVGDGDDAVYNPAATATALKREVWRGPLNALFQDEKNPSWLLAEVTIPPDVGGWYVREAGLWTDTGILYAIVKYPESFKPVLATSGSGKEFYIRSIFETSNASLVTLLIDDTVVKATRAWVMSYLAEELGKLDGKQSVRVAATSNVVLNGAQQIDGVAVIAGDRVLLPNQTLAKDNGLWVVANGGWLRANDANVSAKVTPGLTVMVEEGTANGDSLWHLTTNAPITLGTTALTFKMLAGRTGIAAGSYKSLTVDEYGRATAGANPDTLAGFGIKDSYTKAEVEALIAKASALPVGSIVAFPVDTPPPGFLELDNSVKSSATYPDLSAYLAGKFNKGDEGAGNFRLPEARGEFLRGWDHGRGVDAGRAAGSSQLDSLQNITGIFDGYLDVTSTDGVFAKGNKNFSPNQVAQKEAYHAVSFDASRVARTSTETRPRNIAVMWCIKAWNAPVNQGNIDVAALVKEVQRLGSAVPVGAVMAFPTGIVPPGFLELDGSVQSIATYPDLAAFLGTVYNKGDEGAGNFRLPDSRGEFLRGWDHGRGTDSGRAIGSWQVGTATYGDGDGVNLPIPNLNNLNHVRILGLDYDTAPAVVEPVTAYVTATATTTQLTMDGVQTPGTAYVGVDFMRSRPRNIAVMWCIKAWNAPINQGNIDIAALSEQLQQLSLNGSIAGDIRNARVSIPVAAPDARFTASGMVLGDVNGKKVVISNFNQTINLVAPVKGLGAMDAGAAPVSGFVAMYALYNPVSKSTGIIAVNATTAIVPKLLAGVAPDGYTFSALISILPTNASGQFAVAEQVDRQVFYGAQVFSTTAQVTSLTGLSISTAVPLNAKSVSGNFQGSVSANGYSLALAGSSAAIGLQTFIVNFSGAGGGSFLDVPLLSPQTLFYRLTSAGTFSAFAITTNSYRF
ncbi:phage tail protein [Pseudomonas sp. B2M1-30]|uniref:phage tail-collar fiber domain-containing protein n=1 Tax=Pseudomonas TaxID=286 RepID=UPI0021C95D40|nr:MULTISPECIES: phage tail protein [Pseudomonas]MCU0119510.1 phage tail protein [Pseudomonas sp. B2M1-30]MCU7262324.1 phage tail protein [Pseudomonas koreensis]